MTYRKLAGALACGVCIVAMATPASAQDRSYSISAGSLKSALDAYSRQSGRPIVYKADEVRGKHSRGVSGVKSPEAALDAILDGTPFRGQKDRSGAVAIVRTGNGPLGQAERAEPALAQADDGAAEDAGGEGGSQDIVVTALKREGQSAVRAPAGIASISGAEIEDRSADSIKDFLQYTPSLSIEQSENGGTQIQIRGVNSRNGSGSVGFYLDGLPFSFINLNTLPDPSPFDLRSVEVLRGPQATLYGAGSSGGVIVLSTNDPDLKAFGGKVNVEGSSTRGGGENYSLSGAINIPLVEDRLAIRGTVSYQSKSGWIDDAIDPYSTDLNSERRLNLRLKLLAKPVDELTINLLGVVSRKDLDFGTDISDESDKYPQSAFNFAQFGQDTSASENYDQFGATVSYDFPTFSVKNSFGYLNYDSKLAVLSTTPIPSIYATDIYTNELRINSRHSGPFSWVAGVYYRDARQTLFQDAQYIGLPLNADDRTRSKQFSVYGDATLALLDRKLEISAGASYFEDKTENIGNLAPFIPLPAISQVRTKKFSPQFTVAYHPTENSTIYARYATGFRPGTVDFSISTLFAQFSVPSVTGIVQDETTKAFEIGVKGRLFDNMLYAELVLYRNDVEDPQQNAQVTSLGVSANTIINAGASRTQGVELLFNLTPVKGLKIDVSGSYIDAGVRGDFYAPGSDPATSAPIFRDGDPLYLVPKWIFSGGASYSWDIDSSGLKATVAGNAQYTSRRPLPVFLGTPLYGDPILRADARVEVGRDDWAVYAFAENLNNERDAVLGTAVAGVYRGLGLPVDGDIGPRLRPRTFGLGFRANF